MEEDRIRKRVKELIDASGLTQQAIADKMGLTGGHLSKILSGADGRTVKISHLAKISEALNLPMSAFFQDSPLKVPVIGEIDAYGGPPTLAADAKEGDEYVDLLSDFQKENCYAVKIKDRSMLPLFRPGTLLTAEHDSWEMIKSDDMVIYRGSENLQARQITITPESIILRGFNPSVEELILPRTHLKLCDKVIQIFFP